MSIVHWGSNAWSQPAGANPASPGILRSLTGTPSNTGTAGNWMIAVWAVRQFPGVTCTMAVGDSAHNYWEPLGAPNGVSSANGITRCGIWAARSPRAAGLLFASRSGPSMAGVVHVFEVSGMTPWMSLAGIVTTFQNNSGGLTALNLAAPGSQALVITGCASDLSSAVISQLGSGWTAVTGSPATTSNGTDHSSDLELNTMWQVTTGATSSQWASSTAADLSGFTAAVLVSPAPPSAPSQSFPMVQLLADPAGGAGTPWDQVTWSDLTARYQGMSTQRGKQYELDTAQAGTSTFKLSNNDGHLTPGYSGGLGVGVYNPVAVVATWPPPPSSSARPYVVFRGNMERWPQALTDSRYQVTNAVAVDVLALLTTLSKTITRSEILLDNPSGYWPLADPAGNVTAQNIAPGSALALQVTEAKTGAGNAVQAFGAAVSLTVGTAASTLIGDAGGTCWSQSALAAGQVTQGWTLQCTSASMPEIYNGITVEGWFSVAASVQPASALVLVSLSGTAGPVFQVLLTQGTGFIIIRAYDVLTRAVTQVTVNGSQNWGSGSWFHIGLVLTEATWQVYVNGGASAGASGTCNLGPVWTTLSYCGQASRSSTGGMWNGLVAQAALYPAALTAPRVSVHFWSAITALPNLDNADQRIDRMMTEAGTAYPRCITAAGGSLQAAVDQQGQQLASNISNMAESDGGLLYVDSGGYLCYLGRSAGYNLPVTAVLGENTTAGEVPYLPDIAFDFDPSQLYNDITITQLSAPDVIGGAGVSAVLTPSDTAAVAASIEQYGDQTLQQTSYLYDPNRIQDQANWIFATNGTPQIRVSNLTLDPGSNPSLWPVVLNLEVGQVYLVNRRLGGTQLVISETCQVMSVAHTTAGRKWSVKLTLVSYPGDVLTADDSTRGLLNGSNSLGWLGGAGHDDAVRPEPGHLVSRARPRPEPPQRRHQRGQLPQRGTAAHGMERRRAQRPDCGVHRGPARHRGERHLGRAPAGR